MVKESIYSDQNGKNLLAYPEPWSVKIFRIFAIPLAKGLAKTKVHPNVITILTIPFAFIAAFFFFKNMLIFGAVFFFISFLLDCTDGTLARLTNKQSKFGENLDKYTDRLNNGVMYFGLWYSQYYLIGYKYEGGVIFASHYLIMFLGLLFITSYNYKTVAKSVSSYYTPLDEAFLTFFILPSFGIFFYVFPILVMIQFISHIGLIIKQRTNKKV